MSTQPTHACRRCGTCCSKGGPTLHAQDKPAVEQGQIPLKSLMTVRRGEFAYDPVAEALAPLDEEIIKIKSEDPLRACIYFDNRKAACRIHADRPSECRLLKCWDTADFEAVYQKDRLTRADLIADVEGLWAMVAEHEHRCGYADIRRRLAGTERPQDESGLRRLAETIAYDIELRRLVTDSGRLDAQILDFLFGRPLLVTLKAMYGLNIRRDGGKFVISSMHNP
jgi:Fe-S-cluster containining protein